MKQVFAFTHSDHQWLRFALVSAGLFAGLAAAIHLYGLTLPQFSEVHLDTPSGERFVATLPVIHVNPPSATEEFEFLMFLPKHFQATYLFMYVDRFDRLLVNGVSVPAEDLSPRMNLGRYLHSGTNTIRATLSAPDEYFAIHTFAVSPALTSFAHALFALLTTLMVLLWSTSVARIFRITPDRFIFRVFLAGVLLRCAYMEATPYYSRSVDWASHLEYIYTLARTWALPLTDGLSEAHQMPLYYLIAASLKHFGDLVGWVPDQTILLLQFFSLVTGIGTFIAAVLFGREVLADDVWSHRLYLLVIAVFPALIYISSQVSNDPLVTFLIAGWFLFTSRYWNTAKQRDWTIACLLIGAACLTKASAFSVAVAAVVLILMLMVRRRSGFRELLILALSGLPTVLLLLWRFFTDPRFGLVANAPYQLKITTFEHPIWRFLVFNPLQMIAHPFVYSPDPRVRGEYFFEVALRTSQYGNMVMGRDAAVLLLLAMFLIPFLCIGAFRSLSVKSIPSWVVTLALWASFIIFAVQYPYVPSQNFRYVLPALFPMTYFLVRSGSEDAPFTLRTIARPVILSYVVVASAYFAGILLVL